MSEYEQKDNDLVLFKNDKKETDKHPDYKGGGMVNGKEVWLSAWINKSAKGVTYMSLKTQNKDQAHTQGMQQAQQAVSNHVAFEDDIPFN